MKYLLGWIGKAIGFVFCGIVLIIVAPIFMLMELKSNHYINSLADLSARDPEAARDFIRQKWITEGKL